MRFLPAFLALSLATPAFAQMDFTTDRKLCPMERFDRQELGMSFDGKTFSEIEYYCELATPLPEPRWDGYEEHITPGYCEEPGALYPKVFVLRAFESEPGILYVFQDDTGEPTVYYDCSR